MTLSYKAFNAGEWSLRTDAFLISVMALETDDMRSIVDLSRELVRNRNNRSTEQDEDAEDSRGHIAETTYNSSEIETDDSGDEKDIPGWGGPKEENNSRSGGAPHSLKSVILILCVPVAPIDLSPPL